MPLLEIEQKFIFNPALIPTFLRKVHPHSHPRLPTFLPPLKTTTFHDTYYDSQNKLSTACLWLRKRRHLVGPSTINESSPNNTITTATDEKENDNEEWEVKQSHQNSSYLRSTFSETRDPQKISSLLRTHFPESHHHHPPLPPPRSNINNINKHNTRTDFHHLFNLDTIASFTTTRTTLSIPLAQTLLTPNNTNPHIITTTTTDSKPEKSFTIALDSTDFGHLVGEVELMIDDDDADTAHAAIDVLFKRYPWFFNTVGTGFGKPKGKLTAYFEKFGYPK